MNYTNTSVEKTYKKHFQPQYNSSRHNDPQPRTKIVNLNDANIAAISKIQSFRSLPKNWDSYGAETPTVHAITKAVNFIVKLSKKSTDVHFTAPTPDGGILIELKKGDASLEIEFAENEDEKDSILAMLRNEVNAEDELNETTEHSYLKWLICLNGDCLGDL